MQFSVGVEHALHSLFYLIDLPAHKQVGIRDIARLHNSSESYLSKVFAKLQKAGIVRSTPGAKGGYVLARDPADISFWDVIEAIEGPSHLFRCAEIRRDNLFVDDPAVFTADCPCIIKVVIDAAEERMRDELRAKSLRWLHDTVYADFSSEKKRAISEWQTSA